MAFQYNQRVRYIKEGSELNGEEGRYLRKEKEGTSSVQFDRRSDAFLALDINLEDATRYPAPRNGHRPVEVRKEEGKFTGYMHGLIQVETKSGMRNMALIERENGHLDTAPILTVKYTDVKG